MQKPEPCYVIDESGKKVKLFINTSALIDVVEAFKDLSVEQNSLIPEQEVVGLEVVQKAASL